MIAARCGCCRKTYTAEEFAELEHVGAIDDGEDHEVLEIRNCACRSSLSMYVPRRATQLALIRAIPTPLSVR